MKKIFTLFLFASTSVASFGQRMWTENFNYAAGQLTDEAGGANVSNGAWLSVGGTLTDYAMVVDGSIAYPGYFTNPGPESRKLKLESVPAGAGRSIEDVFRDFPSVANTTNSTVYASFVIQFRSTASLNNSTSSVSGDYFIAFFPSGSTTDYRSRVFVRQGTAANTVQFGITATSSTGGTGTMPIVWNNVDRDANAPHLVTYAYQFIAGANNDVAKLWIDQPYSATEPTPDASSVFSTGTEPTNLSRVAIRQATVNTPNADIDAITVATSYSDVALPLNLTSFTGSLLNKAAVLNWTSVNELNVNGFAVEKGLNGSSFSEIAFVNAKNTATNSYSFEDNNVKGAANYYRLKMLDKDGAFRYSAVVLINNNASLSSTVFPNPAVTSLNVNHVKANKGASISIVGLDGRMVKTLAVQPGATQTGLNVNELVKGNYLVIFENNGQKSVTKFAKQ